MPFRATFDCLWCGASHAVRDPADLEGYAQLCPACIARAGDNGFLRGRLKAGLAERAGAAAGTAAGAANPTGAAQQEPQVDPAAEVDPPVRVGRAEP